METHQLISAIATLSTIIDSLHRAGKTDELDKVIAKMLELIEEL